MAFNLLKQQFALAGINQESISLSEVVRGHQGQRKFSLPRKEKTAT
jgi:hypothetical protein